MNQFQYRSFMVIYGVEYKRGKMLFDVYVFDQDFQDEDDNPKGEFIHIIHDGEYFPAATRGVKSEAMTLLAQNGFIPEEFADKGKYYTLGLPFKIVDYEAPRFY